MTDVKRTQADRRANTQRGLIWAARKLFAEKGYAATSTPEIAAAAGVTRGALYHHYADKMALFLAVVEQEHALLSMAVQGATAGNEPGPVKALVAGGDAFIDAMQDEGRRRILLVDAPAVFGRETLDGIDARYGLKSLIEAIRAAITAKAIRDVPVLPLAHLLNALFHRAALAPAEELANYRKTIRALIRGLKN